MTPGRTVGDFSGSKMLLLCGARLAVIRRDDLTSIPWPGRIDLPGGARDGEEDPEACGLRETAEEIGLKLARSRILWKRRFDGAVQPSWLLVARITSSEADRMRLGDEGQACWMMDLDAYLAADDAIPHQQDRVAIAVREISEL
jgi:8-oxo-dGTP diphosphatase